ncbi:MAG: histidine kinase dimerization/phospho-acceptor domain-containing protein [Gemmatimonadales bacterium]
MTDDDARFSRLRHDLANPLAAILAETQLLLLDSTTLDEETRRALKTIEEMSMKMREILRGTTA